MKARQSTGSGKQDSNVHRRLASERIAVSDGCHVDANAARNIRAHIATNGQVRLKDNSFFGLCQRGEDGQGKELGGEKARHQKFLR